MITFYVRQSLAWWSDGIVRQILGLIVLSPVLIAAIWGYGNLLHWFGLLLGMPSELAIFVGIMMTVATVGGICGLLIDRLVR